MPPFNGAIRAAVRGAEGDLFMVCAATGALERLTKDNDADVAEAAQVAIEKIKQ